jgi:hypothetical protein
MRTQVVGQFSLGLGEAGNKTVLDIVLWRFGVFSGSLAGLRKNCFKVSRDSLLGFAFVERAALCRYLFWMMRTAGLLLVRTRMTLSQY